MGGTFLLCAAGCWGVTLYAVLLLASSLKHFPNGPVSWTSPWNDCDWVSWGLVSIFCVFLGWIGFSGRSTLFIPDQPDYRFDEIEFPKWRLNDHLGTAFFLAIPGLAPALTGFAVHCFLRCFSMDRQRIELACLAYSHLLERDGWRSYPRLESQRQAVILLYHLKLVRISHRFGKLQFRIRRERSHTKPDHRNLRFTG